VNLSQRSQVEPFIVMDVLDRANALARAGRQVFHLEAGQPGTRAPKRALEAVAQALTSDVLGYTEALGRPALRNRIAQYYRETYGLDVAPERIVITTGSSAGFLLAFIALFDQGQSLALATPGYPAYRNIAVATGLRPHFIDCRAAAEFRLSAAALAAAQGIHGALIASPANPTGAVIGAHELEAIVRVCARRKLWLISDEIYHGIAYGEPAHTALAYSPDVVVINSFSKYFSMTGWRIGWMVVPEALVRPIERLAQNLYISPPTISQIAALAALDARDELDGHVRNYAANRQRLLAALKEARFATIAPADGAFYLYADITPFGLDATAFTKKLLDETGVAATPGLDFDPAEGDRWVRFSYAGAPSEIDQASDALIAWCRPLWRN
jgi:aspartate/methionine/tyrosine aminotransferase